MLDLQKDWSISFAGCGFMGIYYVGVSSCILERAPHFIQGAFKIYGASAGALMAAILTAGVPLEKCCADLMLMAKQARKHKLGPLHPSFNLLQLVKDSLLNGLPDDAHARASGRLCVSLTRVSDCRNVLVSEFHSREELIEALICSCFVPFYCGVIPPTYRGVHYVDGAVSDNLPRCRLKNTVTVSAYAGESDLCPPGSALNFHEVRFSNVSIQVNSENMYRVTSTFFPPEPEAMAEICHNGYVDALRFLKENSKDGGGKTADDLISSERPQRSLEAFSARPACCDLLKEAEASGANTQQDGVQPAQKEHWWLDPQRVEHLPVHIRRVFCEACKETRSAGGLLSHVTEFLPNKVTSYLQIPSLLPIGSAYSLAQRLVHWLPGVPQDMNWLYDRAGGFYKQTWKGEVEDLGRETPARRCSSLPSGLNLWTQSDEDISALPLTPEATPTSTVTFSWKANTELHHMSLTPPPTPTCSPTPSPASGGVEAASESPQSAGRSWGLGRAVGWIRNIAFEQTKPKKVEDSMSFSALK